MNSKPESSDIVAALRALADAQRLRAGGEESCRQSLRNAYDDGDLEGLTPDRVSIVFERCALVFDHHCMPHAFVETVYGLYADDPAGLSRDDRRRVGRYRLITGLDGTAEDDYLELWDDTRY